MLKTARFSFLIILSLVFSIAVPAFAFSDVMLSTKYSKAIQSLREKGVIEGYADNTFKPSSTINRAEFLKIVIEGRGNVDVNDKDKCFPDVQEEWYAKYVCSAKHEGIIAGYPDGMFHPEREINFVEASKILALAYEQDIEMYSPDWYEPYARALESSAAIPPTIGSLDQKVTRGEMAEMMWRLSENMTSESSRSYMNVKYPDMKVNLALNAPQKATSCTDLRAFTEEASRSGGSMMLKTMDSGMPTMMAPAEQGMNRAESESASPDYSRTNVQVAGVDEGDIVKTDGSYIYLVRNANEVRIVDARNPSSLQSVSQIMLDQENFSPTDLYIEGNRLIVIGNAWENTGGSNPPPVRIMNDAAPMMQGEKMAAEMIWPGPWMNRQITAVKIYDVSDRSDPKMIRSVSFEGSAVSTRRIGDRVYVVTNKNLGYIGIPMPLSPPVEAKDILPMIRDSANGNTDMPVVGCKDVMILPHVPSPSYLVVGVVPIKDAKADIRTSVVLGSGENVYASLENLYIAATDWKYVWDTNAENTSSQQTRIYRFALNADGVNFQSQGFVPGRVLNQFSMDENGSTFRVATTIDSRWRPENTQIPSSNHLYVLSRDLTTLGSIEDIAPGERIYSVRFMGDRAYMVTFRTIDPLFVIDLAESTNPRILGQLKIPGYSDYLHPYDQNHILGFGKEAVVSKDGTMAWQQGMKVAVFDVSDVAKPMVKHSIVIGDRGTDSPLLQNHKALLFDKQRNLLTFPIRIHKVTNPPVSGGDSSSAYGDPIFQGAHVYTLTLKDGFILRGTVTHYTDEDWKKAGGYVYGKDIDRILRINDSLFTLSSWGIKSNADDAKLTAQGVLSFVQAEPVGGVCPDESKPGVKYVSIDSDECARIRFSCTEGTVGFSNTCGCGCMPL